MKIQFLFLVLLIMTSCGKGEKTKTVESVIYESEAKTSMELGRELFEGTGKCIACHQPEQRIIAPSLSEIAGIYKEADADMVKFLKGEGKPLVDPSQYEVMKTNFEITKTMTNKELKALEEYVLSFAK